MSKLIKKSLSWLKKHPIKILIILIICLAAFVRLYHLPQNAMFEGDQGRDALVVSKIFKEGDLVFIGPVTSVGNMYLGPFYYYFMLPFLWLSYPSPLGPVYAVALVNILAVYLIYKLGSKMFGQKVGILAALFFGLSQVSVTYSRFSWNPNLAPFFSLLIIYFNWKALKKPKFWLAVLASFAALIQLHYLTLLAAASAGLTWLWQLSQYLVKNKTKDMSKQKKQFLISTLGGVGIVFLSLVPLLLFDYKHDWLNLTAFKDLIFSSKNFVQASGRLNLWQKLGQILWETDGRSMHILFEIAVGKRRNLNRILVIITLGGLLWAYKKFKGRKKQALVVLLAYLGVGILGTATYQHTIFNHYIAYLFPVTFLVYGVVLSLIIKKWLTLPLALAFISFFLNYNLSRMPLEISNSLANTRATSQAIYDHLNQDDIYNLVLLSPSQDLDGLRYRYFLSTKENSPVSKEKVGTVNTLVIINEKQLVKPTDLPIYEIVVFPDKEVDQSFIAPGGEQVLILRKES